MHATFFKSVSRDILCARLLYSRINATFNARELFRKWNSRLSRLFMRATFYAFKVCNETMAGTCMDFCDNL